MNEVKCIKMSRSVWWPVKLSQNEIVEFQGKKYRVTHQEISKRDSFYFKGRFYTTLSEV
jgi:hypothetical protein